MSFPGIGSAPSLSGSSLEGYFDASDRIEGGNTIVWWNDFEKDTRCVLSSVPGHLPFIEHLTIVLVVVTRDGLHP
jgi:UDP-glucose:glycoprotein glucosyltransferase